MSSRVGDLGFPSPVKRRIEMSAMPNGRVRMALAGLDGFAAVAAVGGGLALLAGLEGDRFPRAWLTGSPFSDYAVPALILLSVVGGSSFLAAAATLRSPSLGPRLSIVAGLVMAGWIVGEIAILTGDAEVVSPTEVLFLTVGLAMAGLGWRASRAGQGGRPSQGAPRPRGGA
jgi:hypothetical protein